MVSIPLSQIFSHQILPLILANIINYFVRKFNSELFGIKSDSSGIRHFGMKEKKEKTEAGYMEPLPLSYTISYVVSRSMSFLRPSTPHITFYRLILTFMVTAVPGVFVPCPSNLTYIVSLLVVSHP